MDSLVTKPNPRGFFLKNYLHAPVLALASLAVLASAYAGWLPIEEWLGLAGVAAAVLYIALASAHSHLHCRVTSISSSSEVLTYETGIINHHKKKIPTHMITDTSVTRPLYDRILGLSTINISTSGSSGYEVVMPCVLEKDARLFHTGIFSIISKGRKQAVAGQETPGISHPADTNHVKHPANFSGRAAN